VKKSEKIKNGEKKFEKLLGAILVKFAFLLSY